MKALVRCRLPLCTGVGRRHVATGPFGRTSALLGQEQLSKDMPTSTSRPPRGLHPGPGQRGVSPAEERKWKYVKKWELMLKDEWDDLEQFRSLPKPKKQFGNEAAEIIWPYAVLLENVIRVHPFTKSIYCYYGQKQLTGAGVAATEVAKRFARECLIPITFHNAQCYVETEMLLEHNDTPWIVVNCIDGSHSIVPVTAADVSADDSTVGGDGAARTESSEEDAKTRLLRRVLREAEELGRNARNPAELFAALNERPNQNHYVRVDYQWMGTTVEERMRHTVQWFDSPDEVAPRVRGAEYHAANWMNADSRDLPFGPGHAAMAHKYKSSIVKSRPSGIQQFLKGAGGRASPQSNRAGVQPTLF